MRKLFALLLLSVFTVSCTQNAPVLGTESSDTPKGKCVIKEGEKCYCGVCDVI